VLNRARDVSFRTIDSRRQIVSKREPGGDGGGESAARSVNVAARRPRRRVLCERPAVKQHVDGVLAVEVPALPESWKEYFRDRLFDPDAE